MKPSRFSDTLVFLKGATPRRLGNMAAIYGSYFWSKWTRRPIQRGLPFSMSIEPGTHCNLRCPECPSGLRSFTRDTGMIDMDFYKERLDEVASRLWYLTFYFQGEPYLHPRFTDMVAEASRRGIYTMTSTNAHYLNRQKAEDTVRSKLSRLIVSVDGTTQEVYQQYRVGGRLEKVIAGIKEVVEARKRLKSATPRIIMQFLVVKPNEHQIPEVQALGKELGVDEVRLKTAQVYDYENGNPLIPENDKYARYAQQDDGTYQPKSSMKNHCWKLWHSCVMTWDGMVVPCCFDKDAQHQMGQLGKQSLKAIWNGEAYRNFRLSLFRSRKEIDICANCSEGLNVWQ